MYKEENGPITHVLNQLRTLMIEWAHLYELETCEHYSYSVANI